MEYHHRKQQQLLLQLTDKLSQLQDILDDYITLSSSQVLADSSNNEDTVSELTSILQPTQDTFKTLHDSILDNIHDLDDDSNIDKFNALSRKYSNFLDTLSTSFDTKANSKILNYRLPNDFIIPKPIKNSQYFDEVSSTSDTQLTNNSSSVNNKSVRFKQNLIETSPSRPFKPYRDNIDEGLDLDKQQVSSSNATAANPYKDSLFETMNQDNDELDNPKMDLSNKQIFIHNQQQFSHQDDQLDQLHTSIKQQREISVHINRETADQFVLLHDLESGIDSSNTRLIRSTSKIQKYREALKKRGDWMCIIILTFILLFLLLVIK